MTQHRCMPFQYFKFTMYFKTPQKIAFCINSFKDDFLGDDNKPEAEEQPGNSWRLVSHELDDEDDGFPLEKDELQQTTKPIAKISFKKVQVQPQAAPPPKNSPGVKFC
jgi:hypothetical protein